MKQQTLNYAEAFEIVEAPALVEASALPAKPAAAVPDMPKAAGVFLIAAYAALMSAFVITIHGARADFAIIIASFYLFMFFAVPAVFIGVEGDVTRRPDLSEFLHRGIDTATGPISGSGALVQMLIVPVLLALGVLAMGITYLLV